MIADPLFPVAAADVASTNDEWYTPRWLFKAAGLTFDMDVCAPVTPEFRTCPSRQFLTVLDDGLKAPWAGLVWCNPPYSNPLPWAHRLAGHPDWLALFPAAASPWRRVLLPASDGLTLITIDGNSTRTGRGFLRPNGTLAGYPFALILAGRGSGVPALESVARVDDHARGAWFVRAGAPGHIHRRDTNGDRYRCPVAGCWWGVPGAQAPDTATPDSRGGHDADHV